MRRLLRAIAIDVGPLRRHRDFRLLVTGQGISFAGSMLTAVALPFQVYELTGSTLAVGLLGLAEIVPLLVTALLGGALADAHDRRRLVIVADSVLLLFALLLLGNALLDDPHVWLLYVAAAGTSAAGGLQRPPLDAMLPRLVPRDELHAASAIDGFIGNIGQIGAPALAGVLIATAGLERHLRDRRRDVPRLADRALAHARRPAAARRGAAEPRADPRGLALRPLAPGPDGHVRRRHQRDALRHPDRALPRRRGAVRRPGGARPALRRRAGRRRAADALERLGRPGRRTTGARSPTAPAPTGSRSSRFGFAGSLPLALLALAAAGAADMSSGIFRATMWNQTIPDAMRGRMAGIEQLSYSIGPTLGHDALGPRRRRSRA